LFRDAYERGFSSLVKTHRKNIIRKLETTSIVEMMNIAKDLGYIYF